MQSSTIIKTTSSKLPYNALMLLEGWYCL